MVHAHISFCTSKICVWPTLRPWVMSHIYQLWMICTSNLCIVFGASSALLLSLPFFPKPGTACCVFFGCKNQRPHLTPYEIRMKTKWMESYFCTVNWEKKHASKCSKIFDEPLKQETDLRTVETDPRTVETDLRTVVRMSWWWTFWERPWPSIPLPSESGNATWAPRKTSPKNQQVWSVVSAFIPEKWRFVGLSKDEMCGKSLY